MDPCKQCGKPCDKNRDKDVPWGYCLPCWQQFALRDPDEATKVLKAFRRGVH